MSHHFDISAANEDISDVMCFAGPSDDDGPRTAIGMNASPQDLPSLPIFHDHIEHPWDPAAFYELKLDLNNDFVEDITWRFTFPVDPSTHTQHVQVAQLNGADATNRNASGTIITPPNAPVGEVLCVGDGIKIFAGVRLDPFFTDIRIPATLRNVLPPGSGVNPDPELDTLAPFKNTFQGQTTRLAMVELPATITGLDPIQCWGSVAIPGDGPGGWCQVQRAAGADVAVVFGNGQDPYHGMINGSEPSTDLAGKPDPGSLWGMIRDQVATVVQAMGTYQDGKNGQPTPQAYGAFVADTLLPDVLPFTPGTTALWDPWNGVKNGKGLTEELASNFAKMVTNTDFTSKLTQHTQIRDHFPYLAPPEDD
jgi:hypothetical protein